MLGLCLLNSETTSQDGQIKSAKEINLGKNARQSYFKEQGAKPTEKVVLAENTKKFRCIHG